MSETLPGVRGKKGNGLVCSRHSGIFYLTLAAELSLHRVQPAPGHAHYQAGQFCQVRDPEQSAAFPHDDLRIGRDDISPLRRNRAYCAVVEAQQQALAGGVASLADTDSGPTDERMKGVGY
jgi:hypothetical protein